MLFNLIKFDSFVPKINIVELYRLNKFLLNKAMDKSAEICYHISCIELYV